MVSGEASRLGLKPVKSVGHNTRNIGGQWRGFPPGIETSSLERFNQRTGTVVSGEASRLGLKL